MNGYFDMHCHLLPGVDDGAEDTKEMMKMLQIAYNEGIRTIFATPHYHPRRGNADVETILKQFAQVYRTIKQTFPDMELYEGNEIYYGQDIVDMLNKGELLTLANSEYVLIEFSVSDEPNYIRDAMNTLILAGYFPVLAHVERYDNLMKKLNVIEELVDSGVYLQVNAGSVIGDSGGKVKKIISRLIKQDMIHFIGTDAHSANSRAPYISECARYLVKKFGAEKAQRLLFDNPVKVVKNKII